MSLDLKKKKKSIIAFDFYVIIYSISSLYNELFYYYNKLVLNKNNSLQN